MSTKLVFFFIQCVKSDWICTDVIINELPYRQHSPINGGNQEKHIILHLVYELS